MKVLFVSAVPSHPSTAGNRARIRNLVDAAERLGHEVHFAALCKVPLKLDPAMRLRYGSRLHVLNYRPRRGIAWAAEHLRRRVQRAAGKEGGSRWSLDAWYDDQLTPMLRSLQSRERFDTVVVEYVYLSKALEAFDAGVRKVIDTHDRFTDRHRALWLAGQSYDWFSLSAADERRGLSRADVAVAIQEDEAAAFAQLLTGTPTRVETVGHVFDPSEAVQRTTTPCALLVGSDNAPNREGARYFADQVLPRISRRVSDFELLVAGDVGRALPDGSGVRKLGRVAAIGDAYAQAAVALNPVRSGTGLCIKSLETMAFGVPLVTTRSGARGLEAWAGRGFSMVPDDDPEAMAEAVCTLLRDVAGADAMGRSARAAALEINGEQLAALRRVLEGQAA